MRRLLAILLLFATSLPLATPLFALTRDDDAGIPLCCRRNGKHHCLMAAQDQGPGQRFSAPSHCPLFPRALAPVQRDHAAPASTAMLVAGDIAPPAAHNSKTVRTLCASQRTQPLRGPPSERS